VATPEIVLVVWLSMATTTVTWEVTLDRLARVWGIENPDAFPVLGAAVAHLLLWPVGAFWLVGESRRVWRHRQAAPGEYWPACPCRTCDERRTDAVFGRR
jgi:hypothetical protein